jgi:hypothetical protein
MNLEHCTVSELVDRVVPDSYPGGTNRRTFDDFYSYVTTKKLFEGSRAIDVFGWCGYARVPNVMHSEDKLLDVCDTRWNWHKTSNCHEAAGWIYVLRRSRPMTTTGKVFVVATVAGLVIGGGKLLWDALTPKPPVAPPPASSL